jgi:2-dehydro-3-deoxygalactonokinase
LRKFILSCDWGSTSFRLRLVNIISQTVIDEIYTNEGVIHTFNTWKISIDSGADRKQCFLDHLKKSLNDLADRSTVDLNNLDIIISGMASSSIGMYELPYVNLPLATDGSQAGVHIFEADDVFPHRIILISGVKSESDVARGEETQLIGLIKLLKMDTDSEAIFILPGTHSKHLRIKEGKLIDIQTFMTGELYHILTQNSILKDSVDVDIPADLSADDSEAFV